MTPNCIGLVGLGFMGRGIATCLLAYGKQVVATSKDAHDYSLAREQIARGMQELIEKAAFRPQTTGDWESRYQPASSIEDLAGCEFVIETIVEDMAAKQHVFADLENAIGEDVPIASNTSGLSITRMQRAMKHPDRFLGMHFCEPVHATRFLELVRGELTGAPAFEKALRLARSLGKEPSILHRDIEGLIINRLGYAMYREALHLIDRGIADAETIDLAFRNVFGLWATICGPLRWMDLTGLPAYGKVMEKLLPTLSNSAEVPRPMRELLAGGAEGVANGRGFYSYTPEEARRWQALLREHAWRVRAMHEEYFGPIEEA